MGLPNILIEFKTKANTAIKRGQRGIVALIVKEETPRVQTFESADKVTGYTGSNTAYIKRAFIGGINPIKKAVVIASDTIEHALVELEKVKFDYVVGTPDLSSEEATAISNAVKSYRKDKGIMCKAVLPNIAADSEGVINFTTKDIVVDDNTYTTAEYCSRIAGLLVGTPLEQSATYCVLPEVDNVPKFTKDELSEKINKGEFVIFHDGEKVKVGRAVNSLTTIATGKNDDYKSIKIIDIMDLIYEDIKRTCEDNYVGKFTNNYDNKCNLIVAIQAYLESLRADNLLDGDIKTELDLDEQKKYLKELGQDVDDMKELDIKKADTNTKVFIKSKYKILNAIEDVVVNFYI